MAKTGFSHDVAHMGRLSTYCKFTIIHKNFIFANIHELNAREFNIVMKCLGVQSLHKKNIMHRKFKFPPKGLESQNRDIKNILLAQF